MAEVVLGVTGSIAAYKAAELVRLMVSKGWGVSVAMTEAAAKFVSPLTFSTLSRRPVAIDPFETIGSWEPNHILLGQRADLFVIAPCTANTIAKLAHGIADNELLATALATKVPILVAPAMNDAMYENKATQDNLKILMERGCTVASPGEGFLACGAQGRGRLASLDKIMDAAERLLRAEG